MYHKSQLSKAGCTPEKIKPLAESLDSRDRTTDKFKQWIERESSRIRDGVDRNLTNWRLWWALDRAYDAPFHQVSYTLLQDVLSKDYDESKVNSLIEDFGLTHMLEPVTNNDGTPCCGSDGVQKKALNLPVFFKIFVPLCAAYLKARWAKLYNDRNNIPLYKYEPAYSTRDNRIRCDIWTSRIAVMANQLGYANDEKDSIFQALHYGLSIAFPREAWFKEEQLDADGKVKVVREGLRFNMPPPERMYYDMSQRLSTMNYDCGVEFAGYWHITKYGSLKNNDDLWNKDKLTVGKGMDRLTANHNFFANIYPCTLQFPTITKTDGNDREQEYADYASATEDASVLLTEHFTTVIPKEVGIGTYPYPVKFRMVMMNYDVPAYIEPLFCNFGAYYGYDAEGNRARNSSLTLEVMPFQDQIGNILTQWILAAKQNLMNPVFYDRDIVSTEAIEALKNQGEKVLRGRQFVDYSSRDMQAKLGDVSQAFHAVTFPLLPTGEMQVLIRGLLDLLERAMQFSSQEIGQAATHEQSATESNIIHANQGNRVQFTGTFVDDGIWAKKKMIYDACVAHLDDDIWAELAPSYTTSFDEFKELCQKLGIEVKDMAGNNGEKAVVKAPKKALLVEAFASNRDGLNRINNPAMANAAVQLFSVFANNEILLSAIGLEQAVELANQIATLLDLPKDFRLRFQSQPQGQPGQNMMAEVQKQMSNMAQEIAKRIEDGEKSAAEAIQTGDEKVAQGIAKEIGPVIQETTAKIQEQEQKSEQVEQAVVELAQQIQQITQAFSTLMPK